MPLEVGLITFFGTLMLCLSASLSLVCWLILRWDDSTLLLRYGILTLLAGVAGNLGTTLWIIVVDRLFRPVNPWEPCIYFGITVSLAETLFGVRLREWRESLKENKRNA